MPTFSALLLAATLGPGCPAPMPFPALCWGATPAAVTSALPSLGIRLTRRATEKGELVLVGAPLKSNQRVFFYFKQGRLAALSATQALPAGVDAVDQYTRMLPSYKARYGSPVWDPGKALREMRTALNKNPEFRAMKPIGGRMSPDELPSGNDATVWDVRTASGLQGVMLGVDQQGRLHLQYVAPEAGKLPWTDILQQFPEMRAHD